MADITTSTDVSVTLVKSSATDTDVVQSARVSTAGLDSLGSSTKPAGLINYLLKHRHGSPFEHTSMTFLLHVPMVVFWQLVRHRAGWSYNLESGRYRELGGKFYIPDAERPLVQTGKAGDYSFQMGDTALHELAEAELTKAYEAAWDAYQTMLKAGVAREVARLPLGFGIYFSGYATCNARSLMHFLSLRTRSDDAAFPSTPQQEIEMVADQMEEHFAQLMPLTYAAYTKNGRVAP